MTRTRAIRILVIAVCVGGIVGMIVTSATDHNGAAITFGLVTAVAVICQMVATTVVNELTGAPGAPIAGPWVSRPPAPRPAPNKPDQPKKPDQPDTQADRPEELAAADVEARITALVDGGSDETAVRDLVRQAVHLGRHIAAAPPDS